MTALARPARLVAEGVLLQKEMGFKVGEFVSHAERGVGVVVGINLTASLDDPEKFLYDIDWEEPLYNLSELWYLPSSLSKHASIKRDD